MFQSKSYSSSKIGFFSLLCFFMALIASCSEDNSVTAKSSKKSGEDHNFRSASLLAETLIEKQNIKHVVEIGSADSLCSKLPGVSFTGFAPSKRQPKNCSNYTRAAESIFKAEFSKLKLNAPFAVVLLDVDMKGGAILKNYQIFQDLLKKADLVVLESGLIDSVKHAQFEELVELTKQDTSKNQKIDITLTIDRDQLSAKGQLRHVKTFDRLTNNPTCNAVEASRWTHLWKNPSLDSRLIISNAFIKEHNIKTIVEIGGYCTPICRFAPNVKYINIDPYAGDITSECKNATLIKESFEKLKVSDLPIEKPFAFVAVGIGWDKEGMRDDPQRVAQDRFLNEAISQAAVVALESSYPSKWNSDQAKALVDVALKTHNKEIDIEINVQGPRTMNNVFNRHLRLFSPKSE